MVSAAELLQRQQRFAEAATAFQGILKHAPHLATCWYNLGLCQRMTGAFEAALASYQKAIDLGLMGAEEAYLNRAVIYSDALRREGDAARELQRALALNPHYLPALLNAGNLAEDVGRRAAAIDYYQRALTIDPKCWSALSRLGNLARSATEAEGVIPKLRAAIAESGVSVSDRASLGFALGCSLDRTGSFDAAFAAYSQANRDAKRDVVAYYDRAAAEALHQQIMTTFASPEPISSQVWAPIFICGMFRSGSTLAEQILAGHKRVTPCGELNLIPALVEGGFSPFPSAAAHADASTLATFAEGYVAHIGRVFPALDLATDKSLGNYLHVGLIKRIFPLAKIVHTVRNPLDTALSIYFLHLDPGITYAFDLTDIAHQIRLSRRLMEHWRRLYPNDVIDFDYDAFVAHPRDTAESLTRALGLEWDEECLAFHRRTNAVKTASVWQVREPLYGSSSGRWRNYAAHLERLRADLVDLL